MKFALSAAFLTLLSSTFPTTDATDTALVRCGNGSVREKWGCTPKLVPKTEKYGVRCCSKEKFYRAVKRTRGPVCNFYAGSVTNIASPGLAPGRRSGEFCPNKLTFEKAKTICKNMGAEMCTEEEMRSGCTKVGGCDMNRKLVWVNDLAPTSSPTEAPTESPTKAPTESPTESPTKSPTESPTKAPTVSPTKAPTKSPTKAPTESPTKSPTESPTKAPTESPTSNPTESPTKAPTESPTSSPSMCFDNVSLGKTAVQSSEYQNESGDPNRAVDGNTSGVWTDLSISATYERSTDPWWKVDLVNGYGIDHVVVWNRIDSDELAARLSDFVLTIYRNGVLVHTYNHPGAPGASTRIPLDPQVIGDEVKVQLIGDNKTLSLAEVQVFASCGSEETNAPTVSPTLSVSPTLQCGRVDNTLPFLWIEDFGNDQGWTAEKHPRFLEDVNGDGLADIIALGNNDIEVSLSTGCDFAQPSVWGQGFGYNTGWRVGTHPRFLEDVNGDGMRDIIGFFDDGVYVSLSTGNGFTAPSVWQTQFNLAIFGWDYTKRPIHVADVDGDGKSDIVGFGFGGISVALSTGTGFTDGAFWSYQYGYNDGWRIDTHRRYLEDVNGDGLPDIIGFYTNGVHVSLSTGTSFSAASVWQQHYNLAVGWDYTIHPIHVADVDGDGKGDIVGFGYGGISVSLSTGTGFTNGALWSSNYGYWDSSGGWRIDSNPRFVKDVDGDGKADIVGFGNEETTVSLSTGSSFSTISYRVTGYGANTGWSTTKHSRILADVDGDGQCDIVGFGDAGTTVSLYE